ncbi:MAG TPA: transcription-repair coupling factor [Candidatus Kapabacteria bacterium]|nr:transcription-repair coupling factor [Candidatus Kapabacteria bacterium]
MSINTANSLQVLLDKIKLPLSYNDLVGNNIKFLSGASKSFLIKKINELYNKNIFIITPDNDVSDEYFNDLCSIVGEEFVSIVKEPKYTFKSKVEDNQESLDWLIEGLTRNQNKEKSFIIVSQNLIDYQLPNPSTVNSSRVHIKKGNSYSFDNFIKTIMLNGFERKDYVSYQGEISIRGGIVDIYPLGWDNPIRIDFWGDTIESIREFDTVSQRSIREFNDVEFISSLFNESENFNFIDYILENSLIILDSEITNQQVYAEIEDKSYEYLSINNLSKADISFNISSQPNFQASVKFTIDELSKYLLEGYELYLSADNKIHLDRLNDIIDKSIKDLLNSESVDYIHLEKLRKKIKFLDISLSKGFIWNDFKFLIFTEHQIFDRSRVVNQKKNKNSKAITLRELQDLNIGDYIVHEDKGIALFDGFKTVEIGGSKQDTIVLKFAEGDILYVNINYISKISKYSAQEGASPSLSKLGSTEWARKKARTKGKLKDIARDLIKLYAKRKLAKGFAFPSDDVMQKEFEAAFMYEDTPDQSRTTEEIKNDLQSESPMDRLVCGDVGFGKTEVAIRAAFKAVNSGKQVAVLVPTTILAQQHYMSFQDRFAKFPVNVDVISRFRTKLQQNNIVDNLKNGKIDILIGTHRLLSKDIIFKNLGLLVIDEEHRFGVSAKEKLRQLKENIDTLALTATPIPRTLNFSLMGARDLSVMETPPRNRLPVNTQILEWNDQDIIDAIDFEVKRGGQVFFVSDKVNDLELIANKLQELTPDYKIAIAHGQMPGTELEKIMESFIQNKSQILLATKIIESGIDIPNANTMIINRAQNFGLAELYQLRGRVGRTNKQAYCYLLIPETYKINHKALRRLQAIEEFTELGSGFQLSMRDLEIRGAGNLLGAEQSGYIIDIGFELFQRILDEAVVELKSEEFYDIFDIQKEEKAKYYTDDISIEIDRDALFPQDYISNNTDRFTLYKKLYKVENHNELNDIVKEIQDRYGKLPKEAQNLIFAVKLRIATIGTGFIKVSIKDNNLYCDFPPTEMKDYYNDAFPQIIDYISSIDGTKLTQTKSKLLLKYQLNNPENALEFLYKIKKTIELI